MKILELRCRAVRGVPDGDYAFGPRGASKPEPLMLVAGVRGAGKTSFLEAIVTLKELIGAYGLPIARCDVLADGATAGSIGGSFLLTEEERAAAELSSPLFSTTIPLGEATPEPTPPPVRELFARFDFDPKHGKLEYFPSRRALVKRSEATDVDQERSLRPTTLPTKYAGLVPSLIELGVGDGVRALGETMNRGILLGSDAPDSLAEYRAAMATVVPEVRLRAVEKYRGETTLTFERPDKTVTGVWALSGAQKQGVLFAGTMVRLGLSSSIVLVDLPEAEIHVADQARFLESVMSLGHDNQWIVATGSSEPMKGARREQVIALAAPHLGR